MAQSTESPATLQDDDADKSGEASTLDLFDEDTELTPQGWVQFYVLGGIMFLDADGRYAARLPNGNEVTIVDFDRAGLDDTDASYWLTLNWRSANSNWGAWFGSWRFDVTGSREAEIPEVDVVTSGFDAKWYIVEGTYSFYRSEKVDTGIGFGFHIVDIDTNVTAGPDFGEEGGELVSGQLDVLAPLPNVLAYIHWKFSQRGSLVARYGYFGLDYNDYSGHMSNAHVMVNYAFSPRWALGIGYQFVDLELDIEKKDYTQVYDIEFSGPMVFAKFNF